MFKGKKGLIYAVLLNVLVWGFFAYRFLSLYNSEDELNHGDSISLLIKKSIDTDTVNYKLSLNYPDPFLKEERKSIIASKPSHSSVQTAKQNKVVETQQTNKPNAPIISYLGMVKNNTSGLATAIVSINGQSHIVRSNDKIEGITIKGFDNNELKAVWGKEKLVVRR
ncbi:MAG: hypothetical protein ACK50A_08690 [Sphingobacteriaceae bacterium]|jgi:hypothetical protein